MKDKLNKMYVKFLSVISALFSLEFLVVLLFLLGLGVILYTVYTLNVVAFGFSLGVVLIILAFMLSSNQ